jgi:low affinity Fe/Cu permease
MPHINISHTLHPATSTSTYHSPKMHTEAHTHTHTHMHHSVTFSDLPIDVLNHIFTFLPALYYQSDSNTYYASHHYYINRQSYVLLKQASRQWNHVYLMLTTTDTHMRINDHDADSDSDNDTDSEHSHSLYHVIALVNKTLHQSNLHVHTHSDSDQGISQHTSNAPLNAMIMSKGSYDYYASCVASICGSPYTSVFSLFVVVLWGISYAFISSIDIWMLWINTISTIVAYLLCFILQNTKNRHMFYIHQTLHSCVKQDQVILANVVLSSYMTTSTVEHRSAKHTTIMSKSPSTELFLPSTTTTSSSSSSPPCQSNRLNRWFHEFAHMTSQLWGHVGTFIVTTLLVVIWLCTGKYCCIVPNLTKWRCTQHYMIFNTVLYCTVFTHPSALPFTRDSILTHYSAYEH